MRCKRLTSALPFRLLYRCLVAVDAACWAILNAGGAEVRGSALACAAGFLEALAGAAGGTDGALPLPAHVQGHQGEVCVLFSFLGCFAVDVCLQCTTPLMFGGTIRLWLLPQLTRLRFSLGEFTAPFLHLGFSLLFPEFWSSP